MVIFHIKFNSTYTTHSRQINGIDDFFFEFLDIVDRKVSKFFLRFWNSIRWQPNLGCYFDTSRTHTRSVKCLSLAGVRCSFRFGASPKIFWWHFVIFWWIIRSNGWCKIYRFSAQFSFVLWTNSAIIFLYTLYWTMQRAQLMAYLGIVPCKWH